VIEQRDHLAGSSESESTELAQRLETVVRLRSGVRGGEEQSPIAEQLVSLIAPDSFAADQYRSLRHSVERLRKDGLHVLAVTSPGPGDGKSVTALNLAGALAQSPDARVLIVDADLRRPRVAEYIGLGSSRSPGLAEALQDAKCALSQVVRRLEGFNLWVLPAGTPHPSPYELLNSQRLESLLREARRLYDFVLIDTPPLVPFPDCRLLGRWADGFLVIVAAHKTPRKLLAEALSLLDPAKVIGVVLNGDDRPRSDHYGYYQYYNTPAREHQATWWRRAWSGRTVQRPSRSR
jgi:capsular exopolysaccharide synthesis family protein